MHTRISLKAGTAEAFTRKTGATAESFYLPFQAIMNLMKSGASFHVAAMTDTRIVTRSERRSLLDRLSSIDQSLVRNLEEEVVVVDPYPTAIERLRHAGVDLSWDSHESWR